MKACRACGHPIDAGVGVCPLCGVEQSTGGTAVSQTGLPNPATASRVLGCGCLAVILPLVVALLLPKVQGAREAARRSQCKNNLKLLGVALHSYHERYGSFPPAWVANEKGRRMHSWRVLLLPFLDEECQKLASQYNFAEAWDGPGNQKLLGRRPKVFSCPTRHSGACRECTTYAGVFGPHCVFRGTEPVNVKDVTDGTGNTLAIVEVTEADIPWTKPEDVDVARHPTADDRHGISSDHVGGFQAVLVDGSVRFINRSISHGALDALGTCDGGDTVGNY